MFGLELLSAGLLHLATQERAGKEECGLKEPVVIDVVTHQAKTQYDFQKNTLELKALGKGAYSPYESERDIYLRGLAKGSISWGSDLSFHWSRYEGENNVCMQLTRLHVNIDYKPTVYVADEFPEGTPSFNRVLKHEEEHVDINNSVMKLYARKVEAHFKRLVKSKDSSLYAYGGKKQAQELISNRLESDLKRFRKEMRAEAKARNNAFDDAELQDEKTYKKDVAKKLEKIFKLNE